MGETALIIRPGALGDTLMLLPALRDVKEKIQITVAGREPGISFLQEAAFPCIDMEWGGWHRLFQHQANPAERLPVVSPDRLVAYLNDANGIVRRNLSTFFPGAHISVFPPYPLVEDQMHAARYVCLTLAQAGIPVNPERAMERAETRKLLRTSSGPLSEQYIVIHPGSGSPRKNLPPGFWLAFLARMLLKPLLRNTRKTLILLGPAEEGLQPFFAKQVSESLEMVSTPPAETLVSLLERAFLYLGHDSGVTHLAAMLGTPTVAVFRKDDLSLWRPLGPSVRPVLVSKSPEACLEIIADAGEELLERAHPFL
jgi:heptosyltransferase III